MLCHDPNVKFMTKTKSWKRCGVKMQLENHIHASKNLRIWKIVKDWAHTLPSGFPLWELESLLNLKKLESNFRGQNSLDWRVFYIIGKFLKHRCLKWSCMTIWVFITQVMVERKIGNQSANSWPIKVKNRFDLLVCKWYATYCWKSSRRGL